KDARIVRFSLTESAKTIAAEHAHHHENTLEAYEELLENYSLEDQESIARFLSELLEKIRK
ncbi:transcriptional regulator, partial [Streptococcus suis]